MIGRNSLARACGVQGVDGANMICDSVLFCPFEEKIDLLVPAVTSLLDILCPISLCSLPMTHSQLKEEMASIADIRFQLWILGEYQESTRTSRVWCFGVLQNPRCQDHRRPCFRSLSRLIPICCRRHRLSRLWRLVQPERRIGADMRR